MFRVKICGITNWTDARRAIEAGCDALGFNFYPRSPRYIAPEAAARICSRLPKEICAVGVFVNEAAETVVQLAKAAGVGTVQLHGEERPATVKAIARTTRVIKSFRVRSGFRSARLRAYPAAAAYLLDGFHSSKRGGTGQAFEWSIARGAARYGPIVLAGGLTPENVAEAIRTALPAAVDVASGVERSPGRKDPAKLRAFLDAVASVQGNFR
jgi:phosphoribosylanthranilate isomerase